MEFSRQESYVALHPRDMAARCQLAQDYAARGFFEESVAQYLTILSRQQDDAEAKSALAGVLARQMPAWLPEAVTKVKPFPVSALELSLLAPVDNQPIPKPETRLARRPFGGNPQPEVLLATGDFDAREGEQRDRLHGWLFPRVAYGYVWNAGAQRWQMKVRVHHTGANPDLARNALYTALALQPLARAYLNCDPTREWGAPLDIWLAEGGAPGGRTLGHDIYLYAIRTTRAPEEWLRELAHEYGHASLPGVGGFTATDDPWADGELGELLFVKWLAASRTSWLPWSPEAAEQIAAARRRELIAGASGSFAPKRLAGNDVKARDYFLGLALRIEAAAGPRFLGEVLSCRPHSRAPEVIAEAEKMAKEQGVKLLW